MGKPSSTNPMRQFLSAFCAMSRGGSRPRALPLTAILLAHAFAAAAFSQTLATAQPLLYPSGIVFDAQGNLYFAETANHMIREVTPAGVLTTFAGTGTQGFSGDNGPATAAELDSPAGLAIDNGGNLYIADTHNQRVRKVASASGLISTIAGTGAAGFSGDGAQATAALLDLPTALALDAAGNIYIADTNNHRIRRITAATGVIATVAGNGVQAFAGDNGQATAASIDSPNGLALDSAGDLYIADTHNARIRKVNASTGIISTIAGTAAGGGLQVFSGDGGPASTATLARPRGLVLDAAGNLYLADSENHRIRSISTGGIITTVAGQGTEAFTGDGAPAVLASLDSPRSVALNPAGLLTLADTGNARVRQLDALPAPGPDIHTIAGLGITIGGTLTLSGPSVVAYGSGTMTATLTTSTLASGTVTFLDSIGGAVVFLASPALNADAASFSTGTLAAGPHQLTASYAGDATHSAAQSPALALTVTPLALMAVPNPAAILYGQPVPMLGGTLSGVLAQDAGNVAATFSTNAAKLSPVGVYPIAATLTGGSAADYTVTSAPANLTIAQAPTSTTLAVSTGTASPGLPVTLSIQAASTTSGMPTGSVTVLDGTAPLSVLTLSAAGSATYTTASLALGGHSIAAVYSGDANFLPSTSAVASIAVGAASDFSIAPSGANSQSVAAGTAASFAFSAAMQGPALTSPITLAVAGVPLGSTSSINPAYLPPGGSVTAFTLTVQTPIARLTVPPRPVRFFASSPQAWFAVLLLPGIAVAQSSRLRQRRGRRIGPRLPLLAVVCLLVASSLSGCGNRVNTGAESIGATTYVLTVTGTATSPAGTSLQHSVNVTLQVLAAN